MSKIIDMKQLWKKEHNLICIHCGFKNPILYFSYNLQSIKLQFDEKTKEYKIIGGSNFKCTDYFCAKCGNILDLPDSFYEVVLKYLSNKLNET